MVEERIDRVEGEALSSFCCKALSLGNIGFALLRVTPVSTLVVALSWLVVRALHVMVLALIRSVLGSRVITMSLVVVACICLVTLSIAGIVIEPIGSALSPSVVAMARERAWVTILDPVASSITCAAVCSGINISLVTISVVSIAIAVTLTATTLLSTSTMVPVVASLSVAVSSAFVRLGSWNIGILHGLPIHSLALRTERLVGAAGPRSPPRLRVHLEAG